MTPWALLNWRRRGEMKSAETHLRVLVAGMLAGIVILAVGAVVRSDRVRATPEALLHPAKAAAHARLESLAARDETPSALQSLDPVIQRHAAGAVSSVVCTVA